MRNTVFRTVAMTIVATTFIAGVLTVAAEHDQHMKVGKKGETSFATAVKIGDLTLQPGRYTFKHRAEGMDHFVSFVSLKGNAGEVKCNVEPLGKRAGETTVYFRKEDGVLRITRIDIAGENVTHVF